jgi:hypothetical protein
MVVVMQDVRFESLKEKLPVSVSTNSENFG